MRNNVRNYTTAFFGIVPIEKGQAINRGAIRKHEKTQ